MKSLFNSFAFQLWALFSIVGLCISIPLGFYYSNLNYDLLEEHAKSELEGMARASALSIEVAIKSNDLEIVEETIDRVSKDHKFSFIAILEQDDDSDEYTLFKCFPDSLTQNQPYYDTTNYHLISSPLNSEIIRGKIILGISKIEDHKTINALNRPIWDLTVLANVTLLVLFSLFLIFVTNPIRKASQFASRLSNSDYSAELTATQGKNEISVLTNSLISLKHNLISLRVKNDALMSNLQHEIDKQTVEIKFKSQLQELLIKISNDFAFISASDTSIKEKVKESLQVINNFISSNYALILKFEANNKLTLFCDWIDSPVYSPKTKSIKLKASEINDLEILFNDSDHVEVNNEANPVICKIIEEFIPNRNNPVLFKIINPDLSLGGFIVFEEKQKKIKWLIHTEIQEMIKVFMEMIVNLDIRYKQDRNLKALQESLETKVLENTKQILTLSNNLVAQDKLAMIGEISAGIAHDLNTPLGAIKSGVQGMNFCVNGFNAKIAAAPKQYVMDAFNFANNRTLEIMGSGIQIIKDKEAFAAYFERNKFPQHKNDIDKIISLFVEIQIQLSNETLINSIMKYESPAKYLDLVKSVLMMRTFSFSIEESITRSVEVISTLKTYVREDNDLIKAKVNLKENIGNVLSVFRYRISKNVSLEFVVDDTAYIIGNEIKLFQLWSNIIKNALDCLEKTQNPTIRITSESEGDRINIIIANNGPEIPQDIQSKIFKKFFSTKQLESGSGLGLSIAKSVIEEYNGTIKLLSDKKKTQFIISFDKAN